MKGYRPRRQTNYLVQPGLLHTEGGWEARSSSHGFHGPKQIRATTHPSTREIIEAIPPDAKLFCKLDAVHGYFQLALDKKSSKLTTFLIQQGRFLYLRAPMGLNASSDEWCGQSDVIIKVAQFGAFAPDTACLTSHLRRLLQNNRGNRYQHIRQGGRISQLDRFPSNFLHRLLPEEWGQGKR